MEENTPTPINQAPATPVEPVAPPEPIAPVPPVEPVVPVAPVAPAPANNKAMVPVIVGAAVAVAAIGGCSAYAIVKNQPTNVALDAITSLLQQDKITVTGNASVTFSEDQLDETGVKSITITLDEKANRANVLAEATMTIVTKDSSFELGIGEGYIDNGKMYLKVSGLKAALEKEDFEEALGVAAFFENTLEKLDGTWWEIDIPTIVDDLSDMIDAKDRTKVKNAYQCVVDKIKTADNKEFVDLYKSNQFVNVAKYTGSLTTAKNGGSLYEVSLDSEKLKGFVDGSVNTKLASDMRGCLADFDDGDISADTNSFNASEINENLPNVILEIGGFLNHDLRRVFISGEVESESGYTGKTSAANFSADFSLAYPKNLTVEAPADAKPIKEIVESAIEELNALNDLMTSLGDDDCTGGTDCIGSVGCSDPNTCTDD